MLQGFPVKPLSTDISMLAQAKAAADIISGQGMSSVTIDAQ